MGLDGGSVRLLGVNTPELRGGTEETKALGYKAKEYVQRMLEDHELVIETVKDKKGKYGRWLGVIWVRYLDEEVEWVSLNAMLIVRGWKYD